MSILIVAILITAFTFFLALASICIGINCIVDRINKKEE